MKPNPIIKIVPVALLIAGVLTGCGKADPDPATSVAAADRAIQPSAILLAERPAETVSLASALETAANGSVVVVEGRVGGTLNPITEGFAAFVLADEAIWFCDEAEDDHCATPWDACCENPDKVKALRVFVQFTDESGAPLQGDLLDQVGLAPNQTVAVAGELAIDAQGNRRIDASQLWIAPARL
jgi:hypothetical protein